MTLTTRKNAHLEPSEPLSLRSRSSIYSLLEQGGSELYPEYSRCVLGRILLSAKRGCETTSSRSGVVDVRGRVWPVLVLKLEGCNSKLRDAL